MQKKFKLVKGKLYNNINQKANIQEQIYIKADIMIDIQKKI